MRQPIHSHQQQTVDEQHLRKDRSTSKTIQGDQTMNSNQKGKRGERAFRDELREAGFTARRGQQFSGSPDSPDVICDELNEWFHFEVKHVEKLNIEQAMDQARRDAGTKEPIVAHKRNFKSWLITMPASTFWKLLRGDFEMKQ